MEFGGDTSCYEVISDSGERLILDSGTGIRLLGEDLVEKQVKEVAILASHAHIDHLIGFPFFALLYQKGCVVHVLGPAHSDSTFRDVVRRQLKYSFFPLRLEQLRAKLNFADLTEEPAEILGFYVQTFYANHTVECLAYRIERDGHVVVYTGDTEPYMNYLEEEDADIEEKKDVETIVKAQRDRWIQFLSGADLVLYDAQYTEDEYQLHKGFGHSSMEEAMRVCKAAKVKHLVMTHHDPGHHDDTMNKLSEKYGAEGEKLGFKIEFARQGKTYSF